MTDQQTLATEVDTGIPGDDNQNQVQERTYTQKEVDDMAARLRASVTKKIQKQYEDLGDIEELRAMRQQAERQRIEEATKQGNFERVLQDLASKKDAEIARRDEIIRNYRIDNPLLDAAARMRAVAPDQVRNLLRNSVRLNADGEVEITDENGDVRYSERGRALTVDELVGDFLNRNPHFVQATPATTATRNSVVSNQRELDISKLDMSNPEHRAQYREYRKAQGLR